MFEMVQTAHHHTVYIFDPETANVSDLGYSDGSFQKDIGNLFGSNSYVAVETDPKFKAIDDIILINRLVAVRSGVHHSFQIEPHGQENTTVALHGKHNANPVTAPTIKK